jgi:hypothetical protein
VSLKQYGFYRWQWLDKSHCHRFIFSENTYSRPSLYPFGEAGIFRVAIEEKFGKGWCSGFKGCNAWMFGNGLYSAFKGWILSFDGRGSRQEAA